MVGVKIFCCTKTQLLHARMLQNMIFTSRFGNLSFWYKSRSIDIFSIIEGFGWIPQCIVSVNEIQEYYKSKLISWF